MKEHIETINICPRWEHLTPLFIQWLETGTISQKQTARDHIERMAKICDLIQDHKELIEKALKDAGFDIELIKAK